MKSARQQKAQTLKILLLIHNDTAVVDIFKFIPPFLFLSIFDNISGFTNCDYLCVKAVPSFQILNLAFHCNNEQKVLDNDMDRGDLNEPKMNNWSPCFHWIAVVITKRGPKFCEIYRIESSPCFSSCFSLVS